MASKTILMAVVSRLTEIGSAFAPTMLVERETACQGAPTAQDAALPISYVFEYNRF
jgi:hypothetical protein